MCHEVTRKREILSDREELRGGVISRPKGGLRTCGAKRDAGNRPPPIAGSWLESYEFLTLGPGGISHGRGEGEAGGDGATRDVARGRSSQSGYKVGSRRSRVAMLPRGGCQEQAMGFFPTHYFLLFPTIFLLYTISYTLPTVTPIASGATSTTAAQPRIAAAGRGAVVYDLRVANGVIRVRVHATLRKRCAVLGITLGQL
jgi:hypothetical protein